MQGDPSGKIPPLIVGAVVLGGLILASPSPVNAPGPGDPVYYPDNPLILNAAGGAVCGAIWTKFASPFLSRIIGGMGDDIIELGISQGPTRTPPPSGNLGGGRFPSSPDDLLPEIMRDAKGKYFTK